LAVKGSERLSVKGSSDNNGLGDNGGNGLSYNGSVECGDGSNGLISDIERGYPMYAGQWG